MIVVLIAYGRKPMGCFSDLVLFAETKEKAEEELRNGGWFFVEKERVWNFGGCIAQIKEIENISKLQEQWIYHIRKAEKSII